MTGGPLAGLRVVDMTQMLSGPYATMLLGDLGADVVKVEPLTGDLTRLQGPHASGPHNSDPHSYGGYFASVNRNKRSVAVDLKAEGGPEVVRAMAREADVLVENFRSGVMDRLGLSYESLRELNPRLVYTAIRGFGDPRTGVSPYVDWPALDVVAQAMGGFMGITGTEMPTKAGPGVGDLFPASLAVSGTLAAVLAARLTGEGRFVDVAMYDSVVALCERIVYQYSYTGAVPTFQGNGHPLWCPFDVFPAADGYVSIAAPSENHWQALCAAMGQPLLATEDRFAGNAARVGNADEVRKIVSAWTSGLTKADIVAALGGRVPTGPVNTAADIVDDPHVAARAMVVQLEHGTTGARFGFAGNPIKMAGWDGGAPVRAPMLGEHTDAALTESGYTAERIAQLRAAGVIR